MVRHTSHTRPLLTPTHTHTPWEHDWVSTVIQQGGAGGEGTRVGVGLQRQPYKSSTHGTLFFSYPCSRSSQPGTEICWISKVCPVGGRNPKRALGSHPWLPRGARRSKKGRWFQEASSYKTPYPPSLNPLPPHPQPHCLTPFPCPTPSIPTDSRPGTPSLAKCLCHPQVPPIPAAL